MPTQQLPVVTVRGRRLYADPPLRQFRHVDDPFHFVDMPRAARIEDVCLYVAAKDVIGEAETHGYPGCHRRHDEAAAREIVAEFELCYLPASKL